MGDGIIEIVVDWVNYLRDVLLWGNDDPVFPFLPQRAQNSSYHFEAVGLDRKHWSNATPIRTIFKNHSPMPDILISTRTALGTR